jgi:hypothetical protein
MPAPGPHELQPDIVAYLVNEPGQTGGVVECFSRPEILEYPEKRLLARIQRQLGRPQLMAELALHRPGKMGNQVLLDIFVPVCQSLKVRRVE